MPQVVWFPWLDACILPDSIAIRMPSLNIETSSSPEYPAAGEQERFLSIAGEMGLGL